MPIAFSFGKNNFFFHIHIVDIATYPMDGGIITILILRGGKKVMGGVVHDASEWAISRHT